MKASKNTNAYIIFIIFLLLLISCCNDDDTIIPVEWKIINSHTKFTLSDIEFINNNFGIISGSLGTLLKTENGGQTWLPLNVGIDHSFVKVFILNENEFYTSRIGLYKTNNGGNSFAEIGDMSDYSGTIFDIHFFDSSNGLICKDGLIIKTSDGGQNWNTVYSQARFANKMQFVSNNIGFIAGGISYDGISYGELHKTINGGNNWSQIDFVTSHITSLYFINEQVGYITNYNREFYSTLDGGKTWSLLLGNIPDILWDMVFLSENEGYGVGNRTIYKTSDGGITWIKDYEDSFFAYSAITKTPNGKLYVVGSDGIILIKE